MAPWFDDGSLTVTVQSLVLLAQRGASAPEVAERGHTQGKLALVVDVDVAAAWRSDRPARAWPGWGQALG